jgi:hypothetical protein
MRRVAGYDNQLLKDIQSAAGDVNTQLKRDSIKQVESLGVRFFEITSAYWGVEDLMRMAPHLDVA